MFGSILNFINSFLCPFWPAYEPRIWLADHGYKHTRPKDLRKEGIKFLIILHYFTKNPNQSIFVYSL